MNHFVIARNQSFHISHFTILSQLRSLSKPRFRETRMTQRAKKLLDQVGDALRLKHYASSTAKTYVYWVKRFVLYHDNRHPLDTGDKEISEFFTYRAVAEDVVASTHNQALSALLFLALALALLLQLLTLPYRQGRHA